VALSDKLWKGRRCPALEKRAIEAIAERMKRSFWDLFVQIDDSFESIAADGATRLLRSQINRQSRLG